MPQVSVAATVAVPNEFGPRDSARCSVRPQINHVPQTGHRPGCDRASRRRRQLWHEPDEHFDVVGLAELTRRYEHADARLVECVFQLSQPVRWVDVDQNRSNFRRSVLGDHPFRGVGTPDPDPITAFHPEREQPSSRAIDFAKELPVRVANVLVPDDQRVAIVRTRPPLCSGLPRWSRPRSGTDEGPCAYESMAAIVDLELERFDYRRQKFEKAQPASVRLVYAWKTDPRWPAKHMSLKPFATEIAAFLVAGLVSAAAAVSPTIPRGDVRWLNRVTFGINTPTVARYQELGRERFLDEQLQALSSRSGRRSRRRSPPFL